VGLSRHILLVSQLNPNIHIINLALFPALEILQEAESQEQKHVNDLILNHLGS